MTLTMDLHVSTEFGHPFSMNLGIVFDSNVGTLSANKSMFWRDCFLFGVLGDRIFIDCVPKRFPEIDGGSLRFSASGEFEYYLAHFGSVLAPCWSFGVLFLTHYKKNAT